MLYCAANGYTYDVAPYAGAWIETNKTQKSRRVTYGRALRGRVD